MALGTGKKKNVEPQAKSLADAAYSVVEEMIVTRRLAPGDIREPDRQRTQDRPYADPRSDLAAQSHRSCRSHPRRGILVSSVDVIKILELLEIPPTA